MPQFQRNHIVLKGRTETLAYTSNQNGGPKFFARPILNREEHGERISQSFKDAVEESRAGEDLNFVYVVFRSAQDFALDLSKFDAKDFRLSSYKKLEVADLDGTIHLIFEATVYLNRKAVSKFLKKVKEYLEEDSRWNKPKNNSLIANIEEVRAATLISFWQEPERTFPRLSEEVWWEVWLSRETSDNPANPLEPIKSLLDAAGVRVGDRHLQFPEHWVYLMKGSVEQLGASLLYSDRLAEIRKPKDTADFFVYLERQEQTEWIDDLLARTEHITESKISICLLDTGVNRANPLLESLIPERHLDAVQPDWTKADTHSQGHGTPMAGLALYGDLSEILGTTDRIQIFHHLESIKLIERNHEHKPELYGAVTQEAVARGEIINPENKRIVCMAVTSPHDHKGRPSSWSSAIDQYVFGSIDEPNDRVLFFVSSGNLPLEGRINYPLSNEDASIEDPAQAFNAITVGSYTLKDNINLEEHPNAELLAQRGSMSASNTTSQTWDKGWCSKPDIVMEGGNHALQDGSFVEPDSLQLLSSAKGGIGRSWLTLFGDTSASTALASKFAAELYYYYPNFWPETIRALIIHSADWTPSMLSGRNIRDRYFDKETKKKLLSHVGYGVPNMEKARYSANNSLSIVAERSLKPFKFEDNRVKTQEFHLFDLPWPTQALQDIYSVTVKLKITLSYFIEPNPGNKKYDLSASYRSHGLRFKMRDKDESLQRFKQRISKEMREESDQYESEGGEHWLIGEEQRNKGSIHKDVWECSAADLATRDKIAIYPVGGWWKSRKTLGRYEHKVRYSLVVTIEAPVENVDLYTPVLNQISVEV